MGLDVTAYENLKKIDCVFNSDGEPIDAQTREVIDCSYYQPKVNYDFEGREEGIDNKAIYSFDKYLHEISIGYGRYNNWRNELAKLAGYPAIPVDRYGVGNPQLRHDQSAWEYDSGPFYELINFSDCEGVIGPVVSNKLANDFADHQNKADAHPDEYFKQIYSAFRHAFELASNNGAVDFH